MAAAEEGRRHTRAAGGADVREADAKGGKSEEGVGSAGRGDRMEKDKWGERDGVGGEDERRGDGGIRGDDGATGDEARAGERRDGET